MVACADDNARQQLDLDSHSRVLLIGTEAANHFIEGIQA